MICYNCKKRFYVKRNFVSLFETKKYYICNSCRRTHPLELKYQEIPLENYRLYIVSIVQSTYQFNLDSYATELNTVLSHLLPKRSMDFFIFLESFHITDQNIEVLSFLADCEGKSIFLLCGEVKN